MLSSEVGLVAIPHLSAPAGLDDLARGVAVVSLPEVAEMPIYVVPGVRTPAGDGTDGWFEADVMRGEECETLGAYAALAARGRIEPGQWPVFLWPGSHTKLVEVDPSGRITRSHTTLAGELLQAAARHTLLAASLPEALPDDPDPDAAAAGARAVERDGLGRAAFLVRIAALERTPRPSRAGVILDRCDRLRRRHRPGAPSHPHAGSSGLGRRTAALALALRGRAGPSPWRARHPARRAAGRIGPGPGRLAIAARRIQLDHPDFRPG